MIVHLLRYLLPISRIRYLKNVWSLLILGLFIGFTAQAQTGSYPFPQNFTYTSGIMPSSASSSDALAAYNYWKQNFVTSSGACGYRRVIFDYYSGTTQGATDRSMTVSEGIGYGMLLSAYYGDQSLFDDLWNYYQNFENGNGLMNWKIQNCGVIGANGASDADLDVTMALIVASYQWQSDAYLNSAKTMIQRIRQHEVESGSNILKPGDQFGGSSLINPSYFSPAYYRTFKQYDPGYETFWDNVAAAGYSIINNSAVSGTTGLVPDWCTSSGGKASGASGYQDGGVHFIYDAIRTPMRTAIDYLWYGTPDAATYCGKLITWLKGATGNNPGQIGAKYGTKLSQSLGQGNEGALLDPSHNNTFVGCFGLAVMATTDQSFMDAMYSENVNVNPTYGHYFNASLKALTLFMQTGNFYLPPLGTCTAPNLGPDTSLCTGSPLVLNANVSGDTYVWKKDNAVISGATGQTYSATVAGQYEVITTQGNCTRRSTVNVYDAAIQANFSFTVAASSIELTSTSTGGISDYAWYLDGATTPFSTAANPTASAVAAGSHTVKLTITNTGFGCSSTSSVTKTIVVGGGDGWVADDFNNYGTSSPWISSSGYAALPVTYCSLQDSLAGNAKQCSDLPCSYFQVNCTGGGASVQYNPFGVNFRRNDSNITVNIKSIPYVSIKLRSSAAVKLGIGLGDANLTTNRLFVSLPASSTDTIINLDFSKDMTGYLNATNPSYPVDFTKLTQIAFFPYEQSTTYTGVIDIDWIIVGGKSLPPPQWDLEKDAYGYLYYNAQGDSVPWWSHNVNACNGKATITAHSCTAQEIQWFSGATLIGSGDVMSLAPGKYYVDLINQGGVTRDSVTVTGSSLSVDFAYALEDYGRGLRLYNNSTDYQTWQWSYGVTPSNPAATTWDVGYNYYNVDGTYKVCLTVTDTVCKKTDSTCKMITIKCTAPLDTIKNWTASAGTFSNDTLTLCPGKPVSISVDSVSNAATYGWFGKSGQIGDTTRFLKSYTFTASSWLKLEAYNVCGGKLVDSIYINVLPNPVASFTYKVISGQTYGFTAKWIGDSTVTSYTWSVDGTQVGTGIYFQYTLTPGVHSVMLHAVNPCGSMDTTKQVGCTPPNISSASISGPATLCAGAGCVNNYSLTGVTGATTYAWKVPGSSSTICSGAGTTAMKADIVSSGTLMAIATNSCSSDTVTYAVTVNPAPTTSAITGSTSPSCGATGQTYSVTNTSGSSYSWTVPTGATIASGAGTNSITVNFGTTNGDITVVETSSAGCAGPTQKLTVLMTGCNLAANFKADSSSVCSGHSITFTDLSSGTSPSTTYAWSFGSGASPQTSTSTGPITVTYATPGTYVVSLTISEGTVDSIKTDTVVIKSVPSSAGAITGTTSVCSGATQSYSISAVTGASSYVWSVPTGATMSGSGTNVSVTFGSTSGPVTVTPENSCGAGTAGSTSVTVNPMPVTSPISGPASPACSATGQTYSVTNTSGSTYNWTVPTGATIASGQGSSSITVNFGTSNGSVSVTETTAGGCIGKAVTEAISLSGCGMKANFSASTTTACVGSAITFTNLSTASQTATYSWNFGSGATPGTSTAQTPPTVTYSSTGSKTVTLTVTDGAATDTKTMTITVGDVPASPGTITGSTTICSGSSQNYSVSSVSGATSYQWTAPSGATVSDTTSSVLITFGSAGGTVSVAAKNACGVGAASSTSVAISSSVAPSVTVAASATTINKGDAVTFTATPSNGGSNPVYTWYVDGAVVGSSTPTYSTTTLANQDTVYVKLTSSSSCASPTSAVSNKIIMTVNTPLPGTANAGPDQTICASSTTLQGNVPNCGTGTWKVISGSGNFMNVHSGTSLVTGLQPGANVFRWVITGCSLSTADSSYDNVTITVSAPAVSITSNATEICSGSTVNFTATPFDGGTNPTYQWMVDGAPVSGSGTTFSSSSLQNQDVVSVKMTSTSCNVTVASNSIAITVDAQPSPANAGPDQTIAITSTSLAATNPTVGSGTWTLVSGSATIADPSAYNSSVMGLSTGANTFVWTVSNQTCPSVSDTMVVNVGSTPSVGQISGTTTPATGSTVTYSIPSISGPNAQYNWTVPPGATIVSGQNTNTITVQFGSNVTTGNVSVKASNTFGSATSTLPITSGNPPVQQTITGPSIVQAFGQATYSMPKDSGSTYKWSVPSGASIVSGQGTNQITVAFGSTGGTVGVTETNSYGSASSQTSVTTGSSPVSQTISGPSQLNAGQSAVYSIPSNSGSTYNWTVPNGVVVDSTSPDGSTIYVHAVSNVSGNIQVTETNSSGSATSVKSLSPTGTVAANYSLSYDLYPNPFTQTSSLIVHDAQSGSLLIRIVDSKGFIVKEITGMMANEYIQLGEELDSGMYTIQVSMGDKFQVIKFVKIR